MICRAANGHRKVRICRIILIQHTTHGGLGRPVFVKYIYPTPKQFMDLCSKTGLQLFATYNQCPDPALR
ncbi:hypothetical protein D3C85_785100 [compost metagenome]